MCEIKGVKALPISIGAPIPQCGDGGKNFRELGQNEAKSIVLNCEQFELNAIENISVIDLQVSRSITS